MVEEVRVLEGAGVLVLVQLLWLRSYVVCDVAAVAPPTDIGVTCFFDGVSKRSHASTVSALGLHEV